MQDLDTHPSIQLGYLRKQKKWGLHPQQVILHNLYNVLSTPEAYNSFFLIHMYMNAIQIPTSCFIQPPKSKRIYVENGKILGKISISGLEMSGKHVLYTISFKSLSWEYTVNYCRDAVKWLYSKCNFQKHFWGTCFPASVAQNRTFSENLIERIKKESNDLGVELILDV